MGWRGLALFCLRGAIFLAAILCVDIPAFPASLLPDESDCDSSIGGSPEIPLDSWIYPAVWRLYALGYLDQVFVGMRPWTQTSLRNALEDQDVDAEIDDLQGGAAAHEARSLYQALVRELRQQGSGLCTTHSIDVQIASVYTVTRAISGTPLRDSYHLGSTIVNDYGRPVAGGFTSFTGLSGYANYGRLTLFLRGELQATPSSIGYSAALAQQLSSVDAVDFYIPNTTIPYNQVTLPWGSMGNLVRGRFLEAYLSARLGGYSLSIGKQDAWLGPAEGASMAYSNNAENIYALHIKRIDPLYIPALSQLTGPFRYEFSIGPLRGHTRMSNPAYSSTSVNQPNVINPGNPWVHGEKISFRPTENLEFGFSRTVLFGGKGHSPVTLHTFLRSFISTNSPSLKTKTGRNDPGARFASFDFSYRLPYLRNWFTLYLDSEVHDDVSPIATPLRAAIRPGLYLSHLPGVARMDLRLEAVSTDPPASASLQGRFQYWEWVERQGYTNQGQIFGDWIGREAKGWQSWLTYHLSGNEWLQLATRNQKAAKDFIPGGTTLNDVSLQAVKRLGKSYELNVNFALEHWKAPIDRTGRQTVTATTIRLTWFPQKSVSY